MFRQALFEVLKVILIHHYKCVQSRKFCFYWILNTRYLRMPVVCHVIDFLEKMLLDDSVRDAFSLRIGRSDKGLLQVIIHFNHEDCIMFANMR